MQTPIDERPQAVHLVERLKVARELELEGGSFGVHIVVDGSCTVTDQHGETPLKRFDRFLCPHGLDSIRISTTTGAQILRCLPPVPPTVVPPDFGRPFGG